MRSPNAPRSPSKTSIDHHEKVDEIAHSSADYSSTTNTPPTTSPHDDKTSTEAGNDDAGSEEDDGMHGFKLLAILTGITFAGFIMLLDTTILATAVPRITTAFHAITDVGWYGAAYQLGSASFQLLLGKFYANFRAKWTFITFVSIFELGSLICAVSTSSNMFIVGRAIAGLGTSGIQNGAYTILAGVVPLHRRPALTGIVQGVAQFGVVIGPLIGGALTEYVSWRWCFYINLPCGAIIGALLLFIHIPDGTPKPPPMRVLRDLHNKVDPIGFVLFAPACIMLLLALQWGGNTYPWDSSVVIGLIIGSFANAVVWLVWDWQKKEAAMLPLSLLTIRGVWSSCLTFGALMGPLYCVAYYLPIYFQSVKGVSPSLSGVYLLPSICSQLVMAIVAGRLLQHLGYYLPFSLLSHVMMACGYGLLSTLTPYTPASKWASYQVLFGLGRGAGIQMPVIAIQANTQPAQLPIAMGLIFFTATFSGALILTFCDVIFTNTLRSQLREALPVATVQRIIASGGTGFRAFVDPNQLPIVIDAYSRGIDRVFYLLASWVAVGFFTAWQMGWKDIRKKKTASQT